MPERRKKRIVAPVVNEQFRAWTRGTSFTLQMGKTQVATLVAIAASREAFIGISHPMLRHYVTAMRGLEERGLVRRPKGWTKDAWRENLNKPTPLISHQEPTEAGELVIALLRCNGTYDELKREFLRHIPDEYGHYAYLGAT